MLATEVWLEHTIHRIKICCLTAWLLGNARLTSTPRNICCFVRGQLIFFSYLSGIWVAILLKSFATNLRNTNYGGCRWLVYLDTSPKLVDDTRLELAASCLQGRLSTNWYNRPYKNKAVHQTPFTTASITLRQAYWRLKRLASPCCFVALYLNWYSFEIFCFSVNCQSLMYCISFSILALHPYL